MIKILICLLLMSTVANAQTSIDDEQRIEVYEATRGDFNKGLFDLWSDDRIPRGFSTDMLNVRTDEDVGIERKKGVNLVDTLTTGKNLRYMFPYTKNDGSRYMVIVSSKQIYYHDGDFVEVEMATCTNTGNWTGQVINDTWFMFSDDTSDMAVQFDGSTTTVYNDSPQDVRYSAKWNEVIWGAGDTNAPSYLYRCYIDTNGVTFPLQWVNADSVEYIDYIGADDGQKITGLVVFNRNLYIFKERSTYMAYGVIPTFTIVSINDTIGCTDGHGIQQQNGKLMVPSHRGIEEFDGYNFDLKSRHIQNTTDDMSQLQQTFSTLDDTGSDFNAGTFNEFIDTTTTVGRLEINAVHQEQSSTLGTTTRLNGSQFSQSFLPSVTYNTNIIQLRLLRDGNGATYTAWIREQSNTGTIISTATIIGSELSTSVSWVNVEFSPTVTLTAETTYFIYINKTGDESNHVRWIVYTASDIYPRGSRWENGVSVPSTWDFAFKQYVIGYSTFTSQAHNLGSTGLVAFDIAEIEDADPNSKISYEFNNDSYSTTGWVSITDGSLINDTIDRYHRWRCIFNHTEGATDFASTYTDYVKIKYIKTTDHLSFASAIIKDRYYLSYISEGAAVPDSLLIRDRNGAFIEDDGDYSSFVIYGNELYGGSSAADGNLFKLEVKGVYTDSGTSTTAQWIGKDDDFGFVVQRKTYDEVYIVLNEITSGTLTLSYAIDGSSTYTDLSIDMDQVSNVVREGIGFPISKNGFTIRYKLTSTDDFSVRRIETVYRLWDRRKPR